MHQGPNPVEYQISWKPKLVLYQHSDMAAEYLTHSQAALSWCNSYYSLSGMLHNSRSSFQYWTSLHPTYLSWKPFLGCFIIDVCGISGISLCVFLPKAATANIMILWGFKRFKLAVLKLRNVSTIPIWKCFAYFHCCHGSLLLKAPQQVSDQSPAVFHCGLSFGSWTPDNVCEVCEILFSFLFTRSLNCLPLTAEK